MLLHMQDCTSNNSFARAGLHKQILLHAQLHVQTPRQEKTTKQTIHDRTSQQLRPGVYNNNLQAEIAQKNVTLVYVFFFFAADSLSL